MSPVNGDLSVISSVTTVSDLPGLYRGSATRTPASLRIGA